MYTVVVNGKPTKLTLSLFIYIVSSLPPAFLTVYWAN